MENKEIKKVYVVTSGDYSDYHINMIFSDKKRAKDYINENGSEYRLEEYILDEPFERKGVKMWEIGISMENRKIDYCTPRSYNFFNEKYPNLKLDDFFRCAKRCFDKTEYFCFYIKSETMDRAIKIANERLGQIIAMKDIKYKDAFKPVEITIYGIKQKVFPIVNYNTGKTDEIVDNDILKYL